jgi:hypothetical protein
MRDRSIYPGADEPTIRITMPMTDKPLRRDRYRVRWEQKNEIGRVRRYNTRRDSRTDIDVCGSHSLRLVLLRSVAPTQEARVQEGAQITRYLPNFTDLLRDIAIL